MYVCVRKWWCLLTWWKDRLFDSQFQSHLDTIRQNEIHLPGYVCGFNIIGKSRPWNRPLWSSTTNEARFWSKLGTVFIKLERNPVNIGIWLSFPFSQYLGDWYTQQVIFATYVLPTDTCSRAQYGSFENGTVSVYNIGKVLICSYFIAWMTIPLDIPLWQRLTQRAWCNATKHEIMPMQQMVTCIIFETRIHHRGHIRRGVRMGGAGWPRGSPWRAGGELWWLRGPILGHRHRLRVLRLRIFLLGRSHRGGEEWECFHPHQGYVSLWWDGEKRPSDVNGTAKVGDWLFLSMFSPKQKQS